MAAEMTIDQILRDLNYCDNQFPEAAWQAALRNRDEIVPRLMAEIDNAISVVEDGRLVRTWGHIAALFLLTEFDEKEAFPVILESLCCPEVEDLYGNFLFEVLPQIAAKLADGPDQFTRVIGDSDVDEFVRGALVAAAFGMVCDAKITREEAVQVLREWLETATGDREQHVVTKCVKMLGQLRAEEARQDVHSAIEAELVDEEWFGRDDFEQQMSRGHAAFEDARTAYLEGRNTIGHDSLRTLPWFTQGPLRSHDLESVLREIRTPFTQLPADAVRWARQHPVEITPHLIRMIEDITESVSDREADDDRPESHGHLVALYLLTEFDAHEVAPVILSLLSESNSPVIDRFRDLIDQDLAQMLGRLADGPEQLLPLVNNPDADQFVRRDAVSAVVWMVTEDRLDRNHAIELLQNWFQDSRGRGDTILSTWIANALMDLGASATCQTLVQACDDGELEEVWICTEEIEDALSNGNNTFSETLAAHRQARIEHTVVELAAWDWDRSRIDDDDDGDGDDDWGGVDDLSQDEAFKKLWTGLRQKYTDTELFELVKAMPDTAMLTKSIAEDFPSEHSPATIRNSQPKVGRNDPCPCGSGKKHKKCCARNDG